MKKDDKVIKEVMHDVGDIILMHTDSTENGHSFMKQNFRKCYNADITPAYEIKVLEGQLCIVCTQPFMEKVYGKVQWVVDNEASIKLADNSFIIVNIAEDKWRVFESAMPSFQSEVAKLSDDELRDAINNMRVQRSIINIPKLRKKIIKKSKPPINKGLDKLLSSLSLEQQAKLLEKLGI